MSWREIRPVALGAVRRDDELLVAEFDDPDTGEVFYRLLGGGVEFGEHSRNTVVREFEEELGIQFHVDRCIGTFEDIFEFDGAPAHEIWRVYSGDIAESWPYEQSSFDFREPDLDVTLTAHWLSIEALRQDVTFYDPVVLDALEGEKS
jgi:8-oxo-dGTP pyrophosphatase MutT (NUDIX family)